MNKLEREREKLELLQSKDLLLLPGSLLFTEQPSLGPRASHRAEILVTYAQSKLRLLVTFSRCLDVLVLTPDVLPISALDNIELPDSPTLLSLVREVLQALRIHQEAQLADTALSHIPDCLEHLGEICPGVLHELMVEDGKVILLVRLKPPGEIRLCSFSHMLKANRLIDTNGHYFILKMVFKLEDGSFVPEEFAVQYSPDLMAMLPELKATMLPVMKDEKLTEFIILSKDQLEQHLEKAVAAWNKRANWLLPVMAAFQDDNHALVTMDFDTMTAMDIVFNTDQRSFIFTISVGTGDKENESRVDVRAKQLEGGRLTRQGDRVQNLGHIMLDKQMLAALTETVYEWMEKFATDDKSN